MIGCAGEQTLKIEVLYISPTAELAGTSDLSVVDGWREISVFGRTTGFDDRDLVDVTHSTLVHYMTTSLNDETGLVYADYVIENLGPTGLSGSTYVGIRNLSNLSVAIEGYAGRLPDGTYYYDTSLGIRDWYFPIPIAWRLLMTSSFFPG